MACALTKETSPDKVTTMIRPEVTGMSPRRLRQSRRRLQDVFSVAATSPWSPAGLGDVTDKISLRDVAATDGDVAQTYLRPTRPAGDWKSLQKVSKKNTKMFEFPVAPWRPG